jgi:hypothetical protein
MHRTKLEEKRMMVWFVVLVAREEIQGRAVISLDLSPPEPATASLYIIITGTTGAHRMCRRSTSDGAMNRAFIPAFVVIISQFQTLPDLPSNQQGACRVPTSHVHTKPS